MEWNEFLETFAKELLEEHFHVWATRCWKKLLMQARLWDWHIIIKQKVAVKINVLNPLEMQEQQAQIRWAHKTHL